MLKKIFTVFLPLLAAMPLWAQVRVSGTVSDEKLSEAVQKVFDFRPAAIIERLNLRRPIYRQVAAYGHFGRPDLDLTWEKADQTEALKKAVLA